MTRFLLPFCLVIGEITSVCLGQDANWKLNNYHTLLYRYPRDSQDRIRTVLIPRIAAEVKPHELELKFSFNNSTSPRAHGVSDDERILGIGLVWMKVSSAAP